MQRLHVIVKLFSRGGNFSMTKSIVTRSFCRKVEGNEGSNSENKVQMNSFAKSFERFSQPEVKKEPEVPKTFAGLVRYSKLVDLGDPEGKIVTGKIFHIVDNDLYIDFGWKFHCVCTKPLKNTQEYVRGATVRLRIKDLELSTKFLGATKDLTILEADCTLLGLISSPIRSQTISKKLE